MAIPRTYTADDLLVRPRTAAEQNASADPDLLLEVTPASAGWDFISFQVRRLEAGATWRFETGSNELALVDQDGRFAVAASCGAWPEVGGRRTVFAGAGHLLYLPRHTTFTVTALEPCTFAVAWTPADVDYPPFLIKPDQVPISIRGGDNASRQINDLLPPGSPVQRLVLVEVYTPSGNWSSYPPHKHDVHRVDPDGVLVEAKLEEVYYYRIDRPEGYAYQRVYTDEHSPLHQAGFPMDALVRAEDGTAVLIPEGYHPVVSAPGYTTYYLNVLAGSAQSLANQDDPRYAWVKGSYRGVDPRLPLY
jgi:5-deoxy-glucuronate isomerase